MTRAIGAAWFFLLVLVASVARGQSWQTWEQCELAAERYFDGDSFHVRHRGRDTIVRLYFVDAPETDDGYGSLVQEQAQWFRISQSTVLRAGDAAKAFTAKFLAGGFRVRTRLQPAPGASRTQRYYGIVEAKGRRLDEALVTAGLARVSGALADFPDEASGRKTVLALRQAETLAAKERRGAWAFANGSKERLADEVKPRAGAGAALSRVNVNTATQAELEALPGIGPKTAQSILRARPLRDLEALDAIPGIGPKTIESLRELIRFE